MNCDYDKDEVKETLVELCWTALLVFLAIVLFLGVVLGFAALFVGCASHTIAVPHINPTTQLAAHPIASVEHSISTLTTLSEWVNGISFAVLAVGVGLCVYGLVSADKPLEHLGLIVAAVAGSGVALGLIGIIVLPFAPWVVLGLGVIGLGGLGWEIYVKFFNKKALTAASPVV